MAARFQTVMDYKDEQILARIRHELRLSHSQAQALFQDMLRFLFLHVLERPPHDHVHFSPPPKIDRAWHMFILDTRAYEYFSINVLEWTVHHDPRLARKGSQEEQRMHAHTLYTIKRATHHYRTLSKNWHVPPLKKQKKATRDPEEVPVC